MVAIVFRRGCKLNLRDNQWWSERGRSRHHLSAPAPGDMWSLELCQSPPRLWSLTPGPWPEQYSGCWFIYNVSMREVVERDQRFNSIKVSHHSVKDQRFPARWLRTCIKQKSCTSSLQQDRKSKSPLKKNCNQAVAYYLRDKRDPESFIY